MLQWRLTSTLARQLSTRPVVESNKNVPKPFKVNINDNDIYFQSNF